MDRQLDKIFSDCRMLILCESVLEEISSELPKVAQVFHAVMKLNLACQQLNGRLQTLCIEAYLRLALRQMVIWRDAGEAVFSGADFTVAHELFVWITPVQFLVKSFWNSSDWRHEARKFLPNVLRHRSRFTDTRWCQKETAWRKLFHQAD